MRNFFNRSMDNQIWSQKFIQAIVIIFAAWIISIGIIYIKAWVGPTSAPAAGSGAIAVDGSGNVGIGTTSPNEKLTVDGVMSLQEQSSSPSATSGYGKIYTKIIDGGIDSYAKLMLHSNGTNGSTIFTDDSSSSHAVTANGNAQISTAQNKFGGSSAYFDGTGDYLTIPDSADWNFGSGDFTVDFWVRFSNFSNYMGLFNQGDYSGTSNNAFLFRVPTGGASLEFVYSIDGSAMIVAGSHPVSLSINTWYHIAVVRNGSSLDVYVDGLKQGATYNIGSSVIYDSSRVWEIGRFEGGVNYYFPGYLDEFRISKGIARWTSDFTPPTSEYSVGNLFYQDEDGDEYQIQLSN